MVMLVLLMFVEFQILKIALMFISLSLPLQQALVYTVDTNTVSVNHHTNTNASPNTNNDDPPASGPPPRAGHELPRLRGHALRAPGGASGPRAPPSGRVSRSLQVPDAVHVPRAHCSAWRGGGGGGPASLPEVPDGRVVLLHLTGSE